MSDRFVVRLRELMIGRPSTLDGQWLVEYDPTREGRSPLGVPMRVHLVCSPDRDEAKAFDDIAELHRYVYAETGLFPGDRPLNAYFLDMQRLDDPS